MLVRVKIICIYYKKFRFENAMQRIERSHGITDRWTEVTPQYQTCKEYLKKQKVKLIYSKITTTARERWFLLECKAKFAGN